MQRVLVLDENKNPLMPCTPARARQLLTRGKAAVFRQYPFTIILKEWDGGGVQPHQFNQFMEVQLCALLFAQGAVIPTAYKFGRGDGHDDSQAVRGAE